ncbi:chymotrypsin family serine protease [Actinomadura harenae]|uniref:hypothetical protein n=1 Tax=Actinomadura harenae TaxID=2483351 RepID=UPI000EFC0F71|nr:hypothetical protein [Actinomadura harenae]
MSLKSLTERALRGDGLVLTTKDKARAIAAQAKTVAGVPVSYADGGVASLDSGRYEDTPPYYAGGAILNDDFPGRGVRCTAGWPVIDGRGISYLLTAGHCGRPGGGWRNGEWSRWIGTATQEHAGHDLLLIDASSAGRMWDGSNTGDYTKRVAGWDWAYVNEWICQSGSTSGAVCGIQNTDNFTYASWFDADAYGNRNFLYDLVVARRADGGLPSQHGDSGGPVFGVSGVTDVVAKGTVTGHDGSTFYYQDFGTAWRDFGITPKIG